MVTSSQKVTGSSGDTGKVATHWNCNKKGETLRIKNANSNDLIINKYF